MQTRQEIVLRLFSVALLVVVGASCNGCGGGGDGALTPAQQYAKCMEMGNPSQQASCLITLSTKQMKLKDKPGAAKSRESALEAATDIADGFDQIEKLLELADAYVAAGERRDVKPVVAAAEKIFDEVKDAGQKATLLVRLAKVKLDSDKRDGAEFAAGDLKAAEGLLDDITLPTAKIEVLSLLSDGYSRLDDSEGTKRVGEQLVALPASVDNWSDKVRAMVAVAAAQRTAFDDAAAGVKTLEEAQAIVEGVDYGEDKNLRLKTAFRRYDVAEGFINAGQSGPARKLLDVANDLAQLDPEGKNLVEKINDLRARL